MDMLKTKQTSVPLWRYQCPQCGLGNDESGHLAVEHAIYCEVCVEDGSYVRLARWPAP